MPVGHSQVAIRRDHVSVVGLDLDAVRHLIDWNLTAGLKDLRQLALVFRRHVQDDYVSHATVFRYLREKLFKRLNAAGRRAETNNQKFFG